jgi:response regulator RpfG family c-di-GMP phosphodiesterase
VIFNIFTCLTPFFDFYYTLGTDNVYHRGNLFLITVVIEAILYVEALLLVIKFHKKITNAENIGFASFIFCPIITQIVQIANYGIALNSLGLTISFFIIYINQNQRLKTKLSTTEKQLTVIDNKKTDLLNNTIINMANLIETDEIGSNHARRITQLSKLIATTCKKNGLYIDIIDDNFINIITKTSALHDIGNISVPYPILRKPSKVTPEEFETIKTHAAIGSQMVNEILSVGFEREYIKMAEDICKYHHERWDGNGYPERKKGKEIPLAARIVALADVFDALVTPRCYKNSVSFDEAFRVIDNESGKQFDPELVMEFLRIKKQLKEIINTYSDSSYED